MRTARPRKARRRVFAVTAVGAAGAVAATAVALAPASEAAKECSDVQVIFARATGEPQGLGILGRPFVQGVKQGLPGRSVSSYAVRYPADFSQTQAGQGANDLVRQVRQQAAACPKTRFVLGGYSQGASVVNIALGTGGTLGRGAQLPASLTSKVAAVAVFGNPGRKFAGGPLTSRRTAVASKAIDLCNTGDSICDRGGFSIAAHLRYQGRPLNQAVAFTVAQVKTGKGTKPSTDLEPDDSADQFGPIPGGWQQFRRLIDWRR